jgi:pyruvate formate-lyase activating enzyme-like uncharacterized protein
MKQNKKYQKEIIETMLNLNNLKKNLGSYSIFSNIEEIETKQKNYKNVYKRINENPKIIVNKAKYFIEKTNNNNEEKSFNKAIHYCSKFSDYTEVGCIEYLKILFQKLYKVRK